MATNYDLTLSWRRPLSYRNHSINLGSKSMDWFLHDNGLRHERVKHAVKKTYPRKTPIIDSFSENLLVKK